MARTRSGGNMVLPSALAGQDKWQVSTNREIRKEEKEGKKKKKKRLWWKVTCCRIQCSKTTVLFKTK